MSLFAASRRTVSSATHSLNVRQTISTRPRPSTTSATTFRPGPRPSPYSSSSKSKSKRSDSKTIYVELLQPVDGYGKAGTVIPAPPGLMRNRWYPNGLAAYIPPARLGELRALEQTGEAMFGRDPAFNTADYLEQEGSDRLRQQVDVDVPTPSRAREILQSILISGLEFSRQAIIPTSRTKDDTSTLIPIVETVPPNTPIYGSVTPVDVAKELASRLAESDIEGASRTSVSVHDIIFPAESTGSQSSTATSGSSGSRIRRTGVYEITINVRIPRQYSAAPPVMPIKTRIRISHQAAVEVSDEGSADQTVTDGQSGSDSSVAEHQRQ